MSRIEEALKRAREAAHAKQPATVPPVEVFQDPWAVTGDAAGRAAGGDKGARVTADRGPAVAVDENPAPAAERQDRKAGPDDAQRPAEGQKAAPAADAAPAAPEAGAGLALFQGFDPRVAEKIVATPDIRPAFVEQYRKLAGVLHHAQLQKSLKVVLVTSAMAGEGKTLTSANLALTFSESYRRSVLLIDADLRRPTLHETFQVPNVSGLGDGLRAEHEQKLSLVQISPRLTLLTAGRPDPDPMSGLTSERMKRVIEEAANRFDWVIVDTPPVGLLPDAKLLAGMADATLLVIRAKETPYQLVKRAIETLGRDRIFGIVLNRAEDGLGSGGYDYYSYYDAYSRDRR
jgi:capsular exopolysaccharide synthesis family protein